MATVTANHLLAFGLGGHLGGDGRDGLGLAVMDDHRPPLHQRRGHQVGIAPVTQQQGQIGVVHIGSGHRQTGLVDGDGQEPVDLIQHDRPLLSPPPGGFHHPAPPDRPQLAGIADQADGRPGLGGHVDEGVGLIHGHQPGLVDHDHRPARKRQFRAGASVDPAGDRVFLAHLQSPPSAQLIPAEPVLVDQLRQRRPLHPHLPAGHQRRFAGRGHHHQVPALAVQSLLGHRQHPGLAGPGRADHHLQASAAAHRPHRHRLPPIQPFRGRQRFRRRDPGPLPPASPANPRLSRRSAATTCSEVKCRDMAVGVHCSGSSTDWHRPTARAWTSSTSSATARGSPTTPVRVTAASTPAVRSAPDQALFCPDMTATASAATGSRSTRPTDISVSSWTGRRAPGVKSNPAPASSTRTRSASCSGVSRTPGLALRPSAHPCWSHPFFTRWDGSRPGCAARQAASALSRFRATCADRFDNNSTAGRAWSISPSAPSVYPSPANTRRNPTSVTSTRAPRSCTARMCWRMAAECNPRQAPSGVFTRVLTIRCTCRCGSPSRLVKWATRAVSTVRPPTSTWAAPPPDPGHRHRREIPGDLVRLTAQHPIQRRRHHRVLRRHDRQRLRVVDRHLHKPQRQAVRTARPDPPLHLPRARVNAFHPPDQITRLGQHRRPGPLPRCPGVDRHRHPTPLGVIGLRSLMPLIEIAGRSHPTAPIEMHPPLHPTSPPEATRSAPP